jgi:hypothetical protein
MTVRANQPQNEPGLAIGVGLIAMLAILSVATLLSGSGAGARSGRSDVLLGFNFIAWGAMFLAAYFYSHKTFFFRSLIWVCEHFSVPARREMALAYFALAIIIGAPLAASGLSRIL